MIKKILPDYYIEKCYNSVSLIIYTVQKHNPDFQTEGGTSKHHCQGNVLKNTRNTLEVPYVLTWQPLISCTTHIFI